MKLRDFLEDLATSVASRFWTKRAIGVAAILVSAISTYHRINVDHSQIDVAEDDSPPADSGSRAPASLEQPVVAAALAKTAPSKKVVPPSGPVPENNGEAELVEMHSDSVLGGLLQEIGAKPVVPVANVPKPIPGMVAAIGSSDNTVTVTAPLARRYVRTAAVLSPIHHRRIITRSLRRVRRPRKLPLMCRRRILPRMFSVWARDPQ